MTDRPGCRVTATPADDGSTVVAVEGELDGESAPSVRDQLLALIEPRRRLVVDLSALDFLDSSGLGVLVLALTGARRVDGQLVVRNPTARVLRLIETSSLGELFGLADAAIPAAAVARGGPAAGVTLRPVSDAAALEELQALLVGFENLLRWGDLRPEQVTLALGGRDLADETADLVLAARVRRTLDLLGAPPPPVTSAEDA